MMGMNDSSYQKAVNEILMTELEENLSGRNSKKSLDKYLSQIGGFKQQTKDKLRAADASKKEKEALKKLQSSLGTASKLLVDLHELFQANATQL